MTVTRFTLAGMVSALSEIDGDLPVGGAILVGRQGLPRWLVMACPCGCGEEIRVNLDRRSGPAWRIYTSSRGELSVFPSVWRDSGCGSHFVIWSDRLYLFGRYMDDETETTHWTGEQRSSLFPLIRAHLRTEPVYFAELADELGKVPWDVLDALRGLTRSGELEEGKGQQHGWFRRPR